MFDDVLNKLEEAFSELRICNEVIHNHFESRLAKMDQNRIEEILEVLSLFFKDSCKEH